MGAAAPCRGRGQSFDPDRIARVPEVRTTDANNAGQWGAAVANKFFVETGTHGFYYSATGLAADRILLAHMTTGVNPGDIHTF
jgi:hypothetical protein